MSDQAQQRPEPTHHDDEISLYDIWDVLVRRLPVLLGVAAVVIVLGTVYAVTQPEEYTYTTGIEIAQMPDDEGAFTAVVRRNVVQDRLNDAIIPGVREAMGSGPGVSVSTSSGDFGLLLETTAGPEHADDVVALHQAIVDALAESQEADKERVLTARTHTPKQRVALLEQQLDGIQTDIAEFTEIAENAPGDRAASATQQVGELRREYRQLELQLISDRNAAEGLPGASQPMQTHFVARQSTSPTGAGASLTIALSIVLGGMLGLFAAFFWEFVSNARKRHQTTT